MAERGLIRHKAMVTKMLAYLFGFWMLLLIGLVLFIAFFAGPLYLVQIVMVALMGAAVTASAWYAISREPRRW